MMYKTSLCCFLLMRVATTLPVTYVTGQPQPQQRPQVQYVDENGNPVDYQPPQEQQQQQALVARYQPQQYRVRAPPPQGLQPQQPQPQQLQPQQLPEDYDPNPQYQFSFDVRDDQFTNYQNRKEQREGDKISGSYSVVDSDGFIRTVKYTADPLEGFKAQVTREPTDIVVKLPAPPAARQHNYAQPQAQQVYQQQAQQVYQQQPQQQQRDPAGVVADLESVARQQLQAQARAQQQFALGVQPPRQRQQQYYAQ